MACTNARAGTHAHVLKTWIRPEVLNVLRPCSCLGRKEWKRSIWGLQSGISPMPPNRFQSRERPWKKVPWIKILKWNCNKICIWLKESEPQNEKTMSVGHHSELPLDKASVSGTLMLNLPFSMGRAQRTTLTQYPGFPAYSQCKRNCIIQLFWALSIIWL